MIRFQESTSVGGWPVSGKMQHSSVPRRKIGRAVEGDPRALRADFAHAELDARLILAIRAFQFDGHRIEIGPELVPQLAVVAHRVGALDTAALRPSTRREPTAD